MTMRVESLKRLNRILDRWAVNDRLLDIALSEGVSATTILSYLKYARETGDHRAHVRRVKSTDQPVRFLDACMLAGEEGVSCDELRQWLWPHGYCPVSWRSIISLCAQKNRKLGHVIISSKQRYTYVKPSVEVEVAHD
jgi:hypothetical protein